MIESVYFTVVEYVTIRNIITKKEKIVITLTNNASIAHDWRSVKRTVHYYKNLLSFHLACLQGLNSKFVHQCYAPGKNRFACWGIKSLEWVLTTLVHGRLATALLGRRFVVQVVRIGQQENDARIQCSTMKKIAK